MRDRTWPLAASTLGAVEEGLPEIAAILQRQAASAVELRTAADAPVHTGLDARERVQIAQTFSAVGIEILAVASRVRIAAEGEDAEVVSDLVDHLRLAADLGARFVRVFPGAPAGPAAPHQVPAVTDRDQADDRAARRLAQVEGVSAETGVRVLIETHDSHPRGQDVVRILQRLGALEPEHRTGAIWDVLHPWRVGEELHESARHLLPYLVEGRGYVQIKDVPSRQDTTPVLQGSGAIPLAEFCALLRTGGYTDAVSLEWERHWRPHVEPLEEALAAAAAALEHQQ